MATLDLGTLVARTAVDVAPGERDLDGFERRLMAFARQNLPEVAVEVGTAVAEGALGELEQHLRSLPDGDVAVEADTAKADGALDGLASDVRSLPDGTLAVDADVTAAEDDLDGLADTAAAAGEEGGARGGDGLASGIIAAVVSIPIAGAVIGIGVAAGKALADGIRDGLGVEVRGDRFAAQLGLEPADTAIIGKAAGEAYANNFGASIEDNLSTARTAIEAGLLDVDANGRDAQRVIEQLSGVADVIEGDVGEAARAAGVLIRNDLAGNADEAFDIIVRGQQRGLNAADDFLETLTEYPATLETIGLDAETFLGLLQQGLEGGARDTDQIADSLKEFGVIVTTEKDRAKDAFDDLGLSSGELFAAFEKGGPAAEDALGTIIDAINEVEDPLERARLKTELFGAVSENLGVAFDNLDVTTAADGFRDLDGAAAGAIDTMYDNRAGEIESAFRNIEVAADGIKGALAEAFGPQLSEFADTVRTNREFVVQSLLDIANGAFDMARAFVEASAVAVEGFGGFVTDVAPGVVDALILILGAMNEIPGVDLDSSIEGLQRAGEGLLEIGPQAELAAESIRTNLIENGIDPAQERLNEVGIDQVTQARFADATTALADAVGTVGVAADGTTLAIRATEGGFDKTTDAGRALDGQLRAATEALDAQIVSGEQAGRTVGELSTTYEQNREALIRSIETMGFSRAEAEALADSYGAVPKDVRTEFKTPGSPAAADQADKVRGKVDAIDRSVDISVSTSGAQAAIDALDNVSRRVDSVDGRTATYYVRQVTQGSQRIGNGVIEARADGGPVVQGEPYLVGEDGPELIVAPSDGYVLDARQTADVLQGGWGDPQQLTAHTAHTAAPAVTRGGDVHYHLSGAEDEARVRRLMRTAQQEADLQDAAAFEAVL